MKMKIVWAACTCINRYNLFLRYIDISFNPLFHLYIPVKFKGIYHYVTCIIDISDLEGYMGYWQIGGRVNGIIINTDMSMNSYMARNIGTKNLRELPKL